MPPKVVTAKAPNIGSVQVDNKEWVKVTGDQMTALKLGDELDASTTGTQEPVKAPALKVVVAAEPKTQALSFEEKDRRILVQGLVQALLQSQLMNMIPDNVKPMQFVEQTTAELMGIVKKLSGTK